MGELIALEPIDSNKNESEQSLRDSKVKHRNINRYEAYRLFLRLILRYLTRFFQHEVTRGTSPPPSQSLDGTLLHPRVTLQRYSFLHLGNWHGESRVSYPET